MFSFSSFFLLFFLFPSPSLLRMCVIESDDSVPLHLSCVLGLLGLSSWLEFRMMRVLSLAVTSRGHWSVNWDSVSAPASGAHRDAAKLSCSPPSSLRSSAAVVLGLHVFLHPWQKQNSQVFISWFAASPSNRDELKPNGLGSRCRDPHPFKKRNPLKKHWTIPEITTLNVGISWPLTIFFPPSLFRGPDRHKHEWDWNGCHPWTLL